MRFDWRGLAALVAGSLLLFACSPKEKADTDWASYGRDYSENHFSPLEEIDAAAVAPANRIVSMSLPPARPPGKILGQGAAAVPALIAALRNEAKVL